MVGACCRALVPSGCAGAHARRAGCNAPPQHSCRCSPSFGGVRSDSSAHARSAPQRLAAGDQCASDWSPAGIRTRPQPRRASLSVVCCHPLPRSNLETRRDEDRCRCPSGACPRGPCAGPTARVCGEAQIEPFGSVCPPFSRCQLCLGPQRDHGPDRRSHSAGTSICTNLRPRDALRPRPDR